MADKVITWEEFGKHIYYYDCWIMVEEKVYNVTDFLVEHPGGDAILIKFSGQDATKEFIGLPHSQFAISLRNARYVGKIQSSQPPEGYIERITTIKNDIKKKEKKKLVVRTEKIGKDEVALHKSEESCWIIMNKKVYDVTAYLEEHPGGVGKIMEFAGKDATQAFVQQQHSQEAEKISKQYYIGQVEESSNMIFIVLGLVGLAAAAYFFLK